MFKERTAVFDPGMPPMMSVQSDVLSPHVIDVQTGSPRSIGYPGPGPASHPRFMANQLLNQLLFCAPRIDLQPPPPARLSPPLPRTVGAIGGSGRSRNV
jgi:hypothetical protein